MSLHDRRFAIAASRFAESHALRPWYECRRFAAEASEAQGQWAAAAESWQGVLDARGQIIQDGFTPDLRLAETGRAQAIARAGKD